MPDSTRKQGFRLLEHTADIGIEAWGVSAKEVFAEAARGLKTIMVGPGPVEGQTRRQITLEGEDLGELLVGWLNELVYLFEIEGIVPGPVRIMTLSDRRLRAEVRGEPFTPGRHQVERQVKAATYHQLFLEEQDGVWQARIYLDL